MQQIQTENKPFEVQYPLTIQTYDIDFAGIVSNIVYIRWLEDIRLKIMELYLPLDTLMAKGYCPTLASTQIEYKQALRLFDRPLGKMWLSDLGRLRFTMQAQIDRDGQLATVAKQVCFFVNTETMRPVPIPDEFKAIYQSFIFGEQNHE
jgi:acyl-CoA thioester hydrolase